MPQNLPWTEKYFQDNVAATAAGNLKPFQIAQIVNMLKGKKNGRRTDAEEGANESSLTTIFADGINP